MGLDGVSLRYFNIFGPRQDPSSPYSGEISIFIEKMSQGQRPTIFGDGRQTRDFTYVANAVAANLAAMRHPQPLGGQVFNVGIGQRIQLLDLVNSLNAIFATDLEPNFQPSRAGDVRDSLASLDRIRQVLGYQPTISFEEGLRRTVDTDCADTAPLMAAAYARAAPTAINLATAYEPAWSIYPPHFRDTNTSLRFHAIDPECAVRRCGHGDFH